MIAKILRIDLTSRSCTVEEIPEKIIKNYLGGRGLGAYLLYQYVPAKVNPLSEANHLIFSGGPASGTPLPFSSRTTVNTKSPLTGLYLRGSASGTFAHQTKKAGFWAIDIGGIADSPVYIRISNQNVEFIDASHLWGIEPGETERVLLDGLSQEKAAAIAIGPAGENLVPYAVISTAFPHYRIFGRGGAGCVMGAKKLKGIVISGDGQTGAADKARFDALRKHITGMLHDKKEWAANWRNYGTTISSLEFMCKAGLLPTRNWQGGAFEGWHGIDLSTIQWPRKNRVCAPYCVAGCDHYLEVAEGAYRGAHGRRPEYETVYSFGSQCGMDKYAAIIRANQMCSESGLDTITAGVTIGFAMECFERGLITLADTDGIELRFGNDEAMIKSLGKIAEREGFGSQLARGTRKLSREISGSEPFAMHAKGLELSGYECRGFNGQALQFAISSIGGHHSAYGFPAYVELGEGNQLKIGGKGDQVKKLATGRILRDTLPGCAFGRRVFTDEMLPDAYSALFGEEWSADDLSRACVRIMCQERLFNMREGTSRQDDTLPGRLLHEPKPDGPAKGAVVPLEELKDDYYRIMGWDLISGNPGDSILAKLDIER